MREGLKQTSRQQTIASLVGSRKADEVTSALQFIAIEWNAQKSMLLLLMNNV
jgi:hypothetical protein